VPSVLGVPFSKQPVDVIPSGWRRTACPQSARRGHEVTGVDLSLTTLAVARLSVPGGESEGYQRELPYRRRKP
jgi:hypothetical protein